MQYKLYDYYMYLSKRRDSSWFPNSSTAEIMITRYMDNEIMIYIDNVIYMDNDNDIEI
jgi:hypothetical protein